MAATKDRKISFRYDKDADVLYAYVGKPKPAICEETAEGVLIRRDIKTNKVVGFTIVSYSRKRKKGQLSKIPHFPNVSLPNS